MRRLPERSSCGFAITASLAGVCGCGRGGVSSSAVAPCAFSPKVAISNTAATAIKARLLHREVAVISGSLQGRGSSHDGVHEPAGHWASDSVCCQTVPGWDQQGACLANFSLMESRAAAVILTALPTGGCSILAGHQELW